MARRGSISRRGLLSKTAGVAAGAIAFPYIVAPSSLGKDGSTAPANRIVMGCIGAGGQGNP